eukprot:3934692-Rhodomonas_salina.1
MTSTGLVTETRETKTGDKTHQRVTPVIRDTTPHTLHTRHKTRDRRQRAEDTRHQTHLTQTIQDDTSDTSDTRDETDRSDEGVDDFGPLGSGQGNAAVERAVLVQLQIVDETLQQRLVREGCGTECQQQTNSESHRLGNWVQGNQKDWDPAISNTSRNSQVRAWFALHFKLISGSSNVRTDLC